MRFRLPGEYTRQMLTILALVLLGSGILGIWAWQASVRQHRVATDLLRGRAQLALDRYQSKLETELYVAAMAFFRPVISGSVNTRRPPVGLPELILAAAAEVEACTCAPPLRPGFAFRTDLTVAGTRFAGSTPATLNPAALVSTLRDHAARGAGPWDFALLGASPDLGNTMLMVTRRLATNDGKGLVFGFGVDSSDLRRSILYPLLREAVSGLAFRGGAVSPESLIALTVLDRSGRTLYRTTASPDSQFMAGILLDSNKGSLMLRASLRPAGAARVLAGGMPRSPIPMLLGLSVAALAVLVIAGVLLWRMVELTRMRSDFTSSVTHELRTPLTQILLYGETLELNRDRSPAGRARSVSVITREARRLIGMVENLLHFSRTERRLLRIAARPTDLARIAEETIDAFAPIAADRGTTIELAVGDSAPAMADPTAVSTILTNLLSNAVRYGPADQRVQVRVLTLDKWVRLSVEDEGPGVPPEARHRIWEAYVRLHQGEEPSHPGCGIGLAVVRELMAAHGGQYGVDSPRPRGARFFVDFPTVLEEGVKP